MLSPAVQHAAQQYADAHPEIMGPATQHASIVRSYLTGYAAGYRAPRTARFPLAGDQAFKRLLGQYIGERIDVYHPKSNRYGLLRGLPACYENDGEPFADVEFYVDAEGREEGGGDVLYDANKILPVLYAFEDLATEITLADGRRVVPAVEVAKLAWNLADDAVATFKATLTAGGEIISCRIETTEHRVLGTRIYRSGDMLRIDEEEAPAVRPCGHQLAIRQLLLSYHFAVGLRPEQYKRKEVAATCSNDCASCVAGKEVGRA
jgi:hypothetical protein